MEKSLKTHRPVIDRQEIPERPKAESSLLPMLIVGLVMIIVGGIAVMTFY